MKIAVIGGGTMGVGIAHRFAVNGAEVVVVDVDLAAADEAVARILATLRTAARRGKLDAAEVAAAGARVSAAGSITDLASG
ncbi:MAG: 3-hydroxyacyl-CoA dehydrogenase NAD-binding domain-containing protein, partial [Actinomycetota bacterium]|nr:3-hydroxyacyl-CoA dehydrogenase NAD-binding domain-containing protein [Actinomycetota bacterium]